MFCLVIGAAIACAFSVQRSDSFTLLAQTSNGSPASTLSWTLKDTARPDLLPVHSFVVRSLSLLCQRIGGGADAAQSSFLMDLAVIGVIGVYLCAALLNLSIFGAGLAALAYALICWSIFQPEPVMWSAALLPFCLAAVVSRCRYSYAALFILATIWVNADPGYLCWIGLMTSYVIGGWVRFEKTERRSMLLFLMLSFSATLLSPRFAAYFPETLERLRFASQNLAAGRFWLSPNFHDNRLLALALAASVLLFPSVDRERRFRWLLPFCAALFFAFMMLRAVFLFSLIFSLFCVGSLATISRADNALLARQEFKLRSFHLLLAVLALVICGIAPLGRQTGEVSGLSAEWQKVNGALPAAGELRLFNEARFAKELSAAGAKVFISPDTVEYSDPRDRRGALGTVSQDYITLLNLLPQWDSVISYWGINTAVLSQGSSLANILRDYRGWREVGQARAAAGPKTAESALSSCPGADPTIAVILTAP